MKDYAQEPRRFEGLDIFGTEINGYVGTVSGHSGNARRIVACVNACKDIPSEKLDGLATMARLGIELTDAINDPDGRFNRLEKEHYANEFALDKAGISGEACGAKVSKGIELLASQRDELLAALTHAATDYIDQNGSVPSWWTEKIRQMVKETTHA